MTQGFQLLGACVSTRNFEPKIVEAGTVFAVAAVGDDVWAFDWQCQRVGRFPPDVRDCYLRIPEDSRYQYVEVINRVNLHDKYGQCWVRPFAGRDAF